MEIEKILQQMTLRKKADFCSCGRSIFSEDPLFSGEMGAALVNGIQSNGGAAAYQAFCRQQSGDRPDGQRQRDGQ